MRLGGINEVATELGVSVSEVEGLRLRGEFPPPIANLEIGPVWDLDRLRPSPELKPHGAFVPGPGVLAFGDRFYADQADLVGNGGFADVYRATDVSIPRYEDRSIVAVKVLRSLTDEISRRRFQRELRIVEQLEHDHIIPILSHGSTEEGHLWYAMPLATGTLENDISSFLHDDAEILDVFEQICKGVEYLHAQGIIHRDLSPANILRSSSGSWAVADFGLAREEHRLTASITTTQGGGFGTFRYAAPEMMDDPKNADTRADIYSLGRILYALVKGDAPGIYETPPNGAFRPVIQMATQVDLESRYQNVAALIADARRAVGAPSISFTGPQTPVEELALRIRSEVVDEAALDEFVDLAMGPDGHLIVNPDLEQFAPLRAAAFYMSADSLRYIWEPSSVRFRSIVRRYAEYARQGEFAFAFCDVIADFFERVVEVAQDADLLRETVWTLAELGARHNRWHVRSVVRSLLQRVQDPDHALSAAHGLRAAEPDSISWVLDKFAVRSLHPALREAITSLHSQRAPDLRDC